MVRTLALAAQIGLLGSIAYTLGVALFGLTAPAPSRPGTRERRLVVAIPAHDEARVVGGVVSDLVASDLPDDRFEVWVVADRCSDATAAVARDAGARVAERFAGEGGKGAALTWFLETRPLQPDEALVVMDADNRAGPALLGRLSDELDAGHRAVQVYLDVTDPGENWLTLASALSYWSAARMVHLAHSNLGWPVDLGGTGMCVTAGALAAAGGIADDLVEDADLSTRLTLADVPVHWLHDVRVRDEKPAAAKVAIGQRSRWLAGRRGVARRRFWPLVRHGIRRRRWGPIDQALRLVRPSRTVTAGLTAVLTVVAAVTGWSGLLPWGLWAGVAAAQFVWPIPFLMLDGVALRHVAALPLLAVFVLLWMPIRLVASRTRGWSRTPHRGGSTPSGEQAPDEPGPV